MYALLCGSSQGSKWEMVKGSMAEVQAKLAEYKEAHLGQASKPEVTQTDGASLTVYWPDGGAMVVYQTVKM
jgi:hypothetical protein